MYIIFHFDLTIFRALSNIAPTMQSFLTARIKYLKINCFYFKMINSLILNNQYKSDSEIPLVTVIKRNRYFNNKNKIHYKSN